MSQSNYTEEYILAVFGKRYLAGFPGFINIYESLPFNSCVSSYVSNYVSNYVISGIRGGARMRLLFAQQEHAEIVNRHSRIPVKRNKPIRSTAGRAGSSV